MPTTENDGTGIYWRQEGAGELLLLVQGLGVTSEMWYRVVPRLAIRYRVIVFDNRGVGGSDAPAGPYAIATMAADAAAVLDAAGVEAAHVFGLSMGGMIAQELVLQRPERVRSLILGCTGCGGRQAVPAAPEVIGVLMAQPTMAPEEGLSAMARYLYDPATPRDRIEEDLAVCLRTLPTASSYVAQLQGVIAYRSYSRLGTIKAPTLIIHGEHDQLVPPENGKVLADAIPGARLVMLADAGHVFITDQTDAACEAILSFLEEVSSPGG